MNALTHFVARVRALVFRTAVEQELDRELKFHLDLETEKNVRLGMPAAEARSRARAAFGSVEMTKEAHRDGRGTRLIEDFVADAAFALRSLRRNPGFAAAAI